MPRRCDCWVVVFFTRNWIFINPIHYLAGNHNYKTLQSIGLCGIIQLQSRHIRKNDLWPSGFPAINRTISPIDFVDFPVPVDAQGHRTRCWTVPCRARDAPRRVLRWDHGSLPFHVSRLLGSHPRGRVLRLSRPRCRCCAPPMTGWRFPCGFGKNRWRWLVYWLENPSINGWFGGTTSFGNLHVGWKRMNLFVYSCSTWYTRLQWLWLLGGTTWNNYCHAKRLNWMVLGGPSSMCICFDGQFCELCTISCSHVHLYHTAQY